MATTNKGLPVNVPINIPAKLELTIWISGFVLIVLSQLHDLNDLKNSKEYHYLNQLPQSY
jgi:hypothetical protein